MKTFSTLMLLLPLLAIAQAPDSSTAPPALSGEAVPASSCKQPIPPPRIQPAPEDMDRFSRQLTDYRHCVEQYVKDRSDEMKRHNALARANADAANAAVQQLNDFMSKLTANQ